MPRAITPASIGAPSAAYSHAILVPPGASLLFTSGQLGVLPDGSAPPGIEAQAALCFENIGTILREAGMDFSHVVRFNAFVTERAHFPVYRAVRARYVPGSAFASTLVMVPSFARPELLVEVEVTAARLV